MKYKSFISSYQKRIVPSGNSKLYTKAELSTFIMYLVVFSEGRSVISIFFKGEEKHRLPKKIPIKKLEDEVEKIPLKAK